MNFKDLSTKLSLELGCTPKKAQQALVICAGGEYCYIPKNNDSYINERNKSIASEKCTVREIADKYYLSERQIFNIRKKGQ